MNWNIFQFDSQYLAAITVRLAAACLLGGVIGFEREITNHKPAGFRTHILVSLGSCLVMLISEFAVQAFRNVAATDPTRLGAQVISGIGFLGAGAIIRHGISVKGITTAASIWAVACVGLACGIGFYSAAVIATLLIWAVLTYLKFFEHNFRDRDKSITLYIENKNIEENVSWEAVLREIGLAVLSMDAKKTEDSVEYKIVCSIADWKKAYAPGTASLNNRKAGRRHRPEYNNDSAEIIAEKLLSMNGVRRVSL